MQLDALIGNKATGAADDELGRRQRTTARVSVRLVGHAGGEQGHGGGLVQLNAHIDHAVLQHLELANGLPELLSGFQVVEGQGARRFHAANGFGALRGDGTALLIADRWQGLARLAQ
ncbi:hypothetical protein D3C79_919690 [compost metagenome]